MKSRKKKRKKKKTAQNNRSDNWICVNTTRPDQTWQIRRITVYTVFCKKNEKKKQQQTNQIKQKTILVSIQYNKMAHCRMRSLQNDVCWHCNLLQFRCFLSDQCLCELHFAYLNVRATGNNNNSFRDEMPFHELKSNTNGRQVSNH